LDRFPAGSKIVATILNAESYDSCKSHNAADSVLKNQQLWQVILRFGIQFVFARTFIDKEYPAILQDRHPFSGAGVLEKS